MKHLIILSALVAGLLLTGCGNGEGPLAAPESIVPDASLREAPSRPELVALSEAAEAKRMRLYEAAETGRMTPLARIANAEPGFISNIGGETHISYWTLLRRTGADPGGTLLALFSQPHAVKVVGDETWYIWPDLAALAPEDLIPEKLDFQDRARLLELVGEDGIARIRAGNPYPGLRTAIAEDGRWVYFIYNEDLIEASEAGEP